MQEILEKRQYTSKTFDNEDGSKTLHAHIGHIHYKGTDNSWKDIDVSLEDKGIYWQMTKASYKIFIAKDFGADDLIRFDNVFQGANHTMYYEPKVLAWVNKTDLSDYQVFRTQQSVQGTYDSENNKVVYKDAFGAGIDFEISIQKRGFKKEVVINNKKALELPPTAKHKLVALFRFKGEGLNVKSNDKTELWSKEAYFEKEDGFRIVEENGIHQSFIRPAFISDSTELSDRKSQLIKLFWIKHNGNLFQAKVLPTQFLKDAVYPVRADTTIYSGGNDGDIGYDNSANWNTARDAVTGTANHSAGPFSILSERLNAARYRIFRLYWGDIDTSTIGTDTISAASFFAQGYPAVNDGYTDSVHLFQSTRADDAAIANADYDSMTMSGNDIASFASKAYSTISTVAHNEFVITDFSCINKTGHTKLGFVTGRDQNDNPTETTGTRNYIYFYGEDSASQDPYLEVTYAPTPGGGGAAPLNNLSLMGVS